FPTKVFLRNNLFDFLRVVGVFRFEVSFFLQNLCVLCVSVVNIKPQRHREHRVNYKKFLAFSKASSIPAGFFPPAVAKNGCPPPPPWMYFPSSRIIFPASRFFSEANSFEI